MRIFKLGITGKRITVKVGQRNGMRTGKAEETTYRSAETATRVLMDALTATPCRYETALHMNRPSSQAVSYPDKKKKRNEKRIGFEDWSKKPFHRVHLR